MLNLLLFALILFTVVVTYLFWIRPVLKEKPSLSEYYDREGTLFAALNVKFAGIKQKATTAIVMIAGFVVSAYDFLAPLVAQSGVDVTTLSSKVPPTLWPIIGMALIALVQWFRNLSDKRTEEVLESKGIDPIVVKE